MPIDPTPYGRSEYLTAVQQQPSYLKNNDPQYRDNYIKAAGAYWDANKAAQVRGRLSQMQPPISSGLGSGPITKIPGKTVLGEATPPPSSAPDTGGGAGGVISGLVGGFSPETQERAHGVMSGIHRGLEGGLETVLRGPTAGAEAFSDPDKYPWGKSIAGGWPMVNIEDPHSVALFVALTALNPIATAFKFGPWAQVAERTPGIMSQYVNPAARLAGRTAIATGVGAGVGAAVPGRGEDRTSGAVSGGIQGMFTQPLGEGIERAAQGGVNYLNKALRASYGQRLAQRIVQHFPELEPYLKKESDFKDVFAPNDQDERGAVGLGQKIVRQKLNQVNRKVRELLADKLYKFSFDPFEKETIGYGPKTPPPGETIPEQAPRPKREAVPPRTTKRQFDAIRVPKGEPGAGRILKQGWTKDVTVPGKPEIPAFPGSPEQQVMNFDQVQQMFHDAHDLGWYFNDKRIYPKTGAPTLMRHLTTRAEKEFARQMEQDIPGMGTVWLDAVTRDRSMNMLTALFKEEGVLRGQTLGVPELQKFTTDFNEKGYYHDFMEDFGKGDGHKLMTVIMNGADPSSATSIRGELNPYLRMRFGVFPYLSARPVIPFKAGAPNEGSIMLGLLGNMGAQGVFRLLMDMSGGDEPYENTRQMHPALR